MIQDPQVMRAVSQILQRSERQEDLAKLVHTFVDVGVLSQLANRNHQILYGRRGTGKTHVFKVLGSRLTADPSNAVAYIDARVLGSTAQFSDASLTIRRRCTALFRDILAEIYNALLDHIVEKPTADADRALESLELLLSTATGPLTTVKPDSVTRTTELSGGTETGAGLSVSEPGSLSAEIAHRTEGRKSEEVTTTYRVSTEDKVIFPDLHAQLAATLALAGCHLYILLDEWSSLPQDIQPYLAEFLKRGVLPVGRAVLKIASLEYRSRFQIRVDSRAFGFELGADISTATDLDDYYVFDRNPEAIANAYADMLFRHLASELPEDYLRQVHAVTTPSELVRQLFTERDTFKELARASEGVVRDLINIFSKAFFDSHRRGRESIDRRAIIEAARQWFEQDKSQHLDDGLQRVLRKIVDEVIGTRRARSFLLPRELERNAVVQRLFDARALHLMRRGYADKDNPGLRYNIYSLDYGTYVDLIGTSKQPEIGFVEEGSEPNLIVPFEDKRSIRRIVLTEEVLS